EWGRRSERGGRGSSGPSRRSRRSDALSPGAARPPASARRSDHATTAQAGVRSAPRHAPLHSSPHGSVAARHQPGRPTIRGSRHSPDCRHDYGRVHRRMQTSLNRRAMRRRNGGRRNGGGNSLARGIAISLPLFLFATFVALSAVAFLGAVSAYGYFSRDLTDPKTLENLSFSQPSVIYDRTGKIVLASVGVEQRELVTYAQLDPELVDATTSIEDKNFWTNTGFDPLAIVSAA